jgi:hypothetical protein
MRRYILVLLLLASVVQAGDHAYRGAAERDLVAGTSLSFTGGDGDNALYGPDSDLTIFCDTAAADSATTGCTAFATNDFSVGPPGVMNIDYANGQEATSGQDGFLSSTDWSTFNGKQAGSTELTSLAAITETRGDLIVANATPEWVDLAIGGASTVLSTDGTDPSWTTVNSAMITNDSIVNEDVNSSAAIAQDKLDIEYVKCGVLENPALADDDIPIFIFPVASTVTATSCVMRGPSAVTMSLETVDDELLEAQTCTAGTDAWDTTPDGAYDDFAAGVSIEMDVDSFTGTGWVTLCFKYTID